MPSTFLNTLTARIFFILLLATYCLTVIQKVEFLSSFPFNGQLDFSIIARKWMSLVFQLIIMASAFVFFIRILKKAKLLRTKGRVMLFTFILFLPYYADVLMSIEIGLISLFLIIHLAYFLRVYNQSNIWALVFNGSFIIGILTFLHVELILLLPIYWFGLIMIRTVEWRNYLFSIFGVLFLWVYYLSYLYIFDKPSAINIFREWQGIAFQIIDGNEQLLVHLSILVIISIFSLAKRSALVVHQKNQSNYILLLAFCCLLLGVFNHSGLLFTTYLLFAYFTEWLYFNSEKKWPFEFLFILSIGSNIIFHLMG